jgi:hypothetical protein
MKRPRQPRIEPRRRKALRWLKRHWKGVALAVAALLGGLGQFLQGIAALLH